MVQSNSNLNNNEFFGGKTSDPTNSNMTILPNTTPTTPQAPEIDDFEP